VRAGARVVDEPVDPPVALHHVRDEAFAVGFVGDVADDRVHARQLGPQRVQPLRAARGQHRNGAGREQGPGELLAEPGARAGDDHDAAVHGAAAASTSANFSSAAVRRLGT
jgi:hypothetical protein